MARGDGPVRTAEQAATALEGDNDRIKELEKEVLNLRILNKGKDFFVEQLQKERESFASERRDYVERQIVANHKVGVLETKLLQLEGPK